ncbi:hypothetical protein INR49_025713 [Caranx melampygus]|nr:hypothetical protein INR49_025713 [Caranx melampygus]
MDGSVRACVTLTTPTPPTPPHPILPILPILPFRMYLSLLTSGLPGDGAEEILGWRLQTVSSSWRELISFGERREVMKETETTMHLLHSPQNTVDWIQMAALWGPGTQSRGLDNRSPPSTHDHAPAKFPQRCRGVGGGGGAQSLHLGC